MHCFFMDGERHYKSRLMGETVLRANWPANVATNTVTGSKLYRGD